VAIESCELADSEIAPAIPLPARLPNRRRDGRVGYTTIAMVLPFDGPLSASQVLKCWTRDISPGGARLLSWEPLKEENIVLHMILPGLQTRLVQGRITTQSVESSDMPNSQRKPVYVYGVQFTGVLG
jgi:hypothetical protein